jgi:hypothetical protein
VRARLALVAACVLLAASAHAQAPTIFRNRVGSHTATPFVVIQTPTAAPIYGTSTSTLVLGGHYDNAATITWANSAGGSGSATLTPESSAWETGTISLTAGSNVITVTANDGAGHTSADIITVTYTVVDSTNPTVTITVPTSSTTYDAASSPLALGGTASDNVGVTSITWACPNCATKTGTALGTTAWSANIPLTADASNVITVTARDEAGNTSTDAITVTFVTPLTIVETTVPPASFGVAYSQTLHAMSGTAPYTWSNNGAGTTVNDADSDCTGITITAGGVVHGTPSTANTPLPVTCTFTAKVTDNVAATDTQALSIVIIDPGASTYFDQVGALPEAQAITGCTAVDAKGCSLSTLAQLNLLADHGDAADSNHLSGYSLDTTTHGMPVAKLTWDRKDASVGNNLRLPMGSTGVGGIGSTLDILVIWDDYMDASWTKTGCGLGGVVRDINDDYKHKEDQLEFGTKAGSGRIFFETRMHLRLSTKTCADAGIMDIRTYGDGPESNASLAITSPDNFSAGAQDDAGSGTLSLNTVHVPRGTWVRHVKRVQLGKRGSDFTEWNSYYNGFEGFTAVPTDGYFAMISEWFGTAAGGWQRVVYNAPARVGFQSQTVSVSSLTCSGGTLSLTAAAPHKVNAGETFFVIGSNQSAYNKIFTATTVPTTTTLTVTGVTCGTSPATGTMTTGSALVFVNEFFLEHNTSQNHALASGSITLSSGTPGATIAKGATITISHVFEGDTILSSYKTQAAVTLDGAGAGVVAVKAVNDTTGSPPTYLSGGDAGNVASGASATVVGVTVTAVVSSGGLTGGQYVNAGSLVSYERWVHVLFGLGNPELNATVWQLPR